MTTQNQVKDNSTDTGKEVKPIFIYLEIVQKFTKEVVKRLDVSDKGERQRDRIEMGMNINLNHKDYFTQEIESDIELSKI